MRFTVTGLVFVSMLSSTALALTPLPPPAVIEGHMMISDYHLHTLGDRAGVTVSTYQDPYERQPDGSFGFRGKAPKALRGFVGTRLVHCRSGRFLAVWHSNARHVTAALAATEFLRPHVQAKRAVPFHDLRQAAQAVYGCDRVLVLRDTSETTECAWLYPDLRRDGVLPAEDRDDRE